MARIDRVRHYRPDLEKAVGFSQAVRSGGWLMLAGLCSCDQQARCIGKDDMALQLRTIYQEIETILRDHGIGFADVVRETIYTTDLNALVAAGAERARFYLEAEAAFPAATWLQVSGLFGPDFLLEVEITAELSATS